MIPKYRAWNAVEHTMINVISLNYVSPSGLTVNGSNIVGLVESLMQYTGICDRKGSKIFDGDLLQYMNTSVKQVMWDIDSAGFLCIDFDSEYTLSVEVWKESKIVGNIWENPEMLL